jgi:hypothetical protein
MRGRGEAPGREEHEMAYQLVRDGDYPGTDLPVFKVYDAEDVTAPAIGEVWAVGVKGVTGRHIPTGVRWQLAGTGMLGASEPMPAGAYADAARAMIAALEGGR